MVCSRTFLRLTLLVFVFTLGTVASGQAQSIPARIFRQGNPAPDEGTITGVQGDAIILTLPNGGSTSVPLAQVERIEAAAPATYTSGVGAYNAGSYDKALTDLAPLGEKFRGLPAEWARVTLLTLGNIYLEKNDVAKAEAAFGDYRRLYPKSANSLQNTVAQARIAYAKNSAPQAKAQLDALIQTALKAPAEVSRGDGAAYGQAFYLMAKLQERDANFQGALENYLRVVTLFYQDAGLAGRAQKSADDLRAAHKDVVAP